MFSWITGPRITNVIEDLQAEPAYESTFVDPPETPAHQFAVKAFKHALFGTPAPEDLNNATRKFEAKAKAASVNAKFTELPAPKDDDLLQSPAKRAGGILMTPGTASKGRKTVSFGSQIEDNEGKTNAISRSGVPNNCPGKFPSPWTPGTELKLEAGSDKRPRTKLTEALLDARTTTQPKSGQKPKARDDSDITLDLGAPRSDSGKYWKEQYESYAERSEKEMKKIVAKQQLAKKFAMKKDGEVTELATKLEQERKRFRSRERELEQQNKDFQERLRQAMAESTSTSIENAALKARIATLESTAAMATGSAPEKPEFSIYEDTSKEAIKLRKETTSAVEAPFLPSLSTASSGKENNSPPKSRRARRQTVPDSVTRSNEPSRMGTAKDEFSIILAKSPAATELTKPTLDPPQSVRPSRTPLSSRRVNPVKENAGAGSPVPVLPSSPLPMPSPDLPDPWMNMDESSIPQLDKRAMPTAGSPYVNPAWNPPARQHRTSKSVSQNNKVEPQPEKREVRQKENNDAKLLAEQPKSDLEARLAALSSKPIKKDDTKRSNTEPAKHSPTDPRFDLAKITTHHAEGSIKVKHDRAEMLPVDRKSEARRRLEERKRLRKAAPA